MTSMFESRFGRRFQPAWGHLLSLRGTISMHIAIDGQWEVFSDGELLAELQTGEIKKHVITESINWNPLARFYLQANVSYTLNQTDTPANNINLVPNTSPTVTNFRNDYWTVTSTAGYIIDDKTDFYTDFSFYCANDHFKNAVVAVPYGLGATEYTASATLTRQLTKQMRLLLRYGYFNYRDVTSGGHNNYKRIPSIRACSTDFNREMGAGSASVRRPSHARDVFVRL